MPKKTKKSSRKSKRKPKSKVLEPVHHSCGLYMVPDELCKKGSPFLIANEQWMYDVWQTHDRYPQSKLYTEKGKGFKGKIPKVLGDDGKETFAKNSTRTRFLVRNGKEVILFREYVAAKTTRFFTQGLADVEVSLSSMGKFTKDSPRCYRRTKARGDEPASIYKDRVSRWLILDSDDKITIPDTDLIKHCDGAMKKLHMLIRHPFKAKKMILMPSSGFGIKDSSGIAYPKAHVWILMDQPMMLTDIKAMIDGSNSIQSNPDVIFENPYKQKIEFDPSIYEPAQPIYESLPLFPKGKELKDVLAIERIHKFGKANADEFIVDNFKNLISKKKKKSTVRKTISSDLQDQYNAIAHELEGKRCPGIDVDGNTEMEGELLLRDVEFDSKTGDVQWLDLLCPTGYSHNPDNNSPSSNRIMISGETPIKNDFHSCDNKDKSMEAQFRFLVECGGIPDVMSPFRNDFLKVEKITEQKTYRDKHEGAWSIAEIQDNYIFIKVQDVCYSHKDKALLTTAAVNKLHPNLSREGKDISAMAAFMVNSYNLDGGVVVTKELFDPSTDDRVAVVEGVKIFNEWNGFRINPMKGNTKAFHDHMSFICPDQREADSLTDFIAHIFQRPWERPTWCPVHVCKRQGVGRGLLNQLIGEILGNYTSNPSPKDIFKSDFNGYLRNSLWLGVEETKVQQRKFDEDIGAHLKEIITATRLNLNPKYGKQLLNYPIYARFFFMTNNMDALPIEESDRRFWVIGPGDPNYEPRKQEYYKKLAKLFLGNNKFQAAVLYDLMHRDISNFDPFGVPFDTKLKTIMKAASIPIERKALNAIIKFEGFCPFMTRNRLKTLMKEYFAYHEEYAAPTNINDEIATLVDYNEGRPVTIDKKTNRWKILRNPDKYERYTTGRVRKAITKKESIPEDWVED